MTDEININLKKESTWKRIFFMLLLIVIVNLVTTLLWAVILLQIITTLLTGKVNQHILTFGRNLSVYLYHIVLYLTFNTDLLPFPFSSWDASSQFASDTVRTAPIKPQD